MEKITNYNAGVTMCSNKFCDGKPTYFEDIDIEGFTFQVVYCDNHAEKIRKQRSNII